MSIKVFALTDAIPERSTYRYAVGLSTVAGDPVVLTQVSSILLTLRDVRSNALVNSRSQVEVKNANGGTLTDGLFEFQFQEADTAILGSGSTERRLMTLDFRLVGGGRVNRQVSFYVRNLRDISA